MLPSDAHPPRRDWEVVVVEAHRSRSREGELARAYEVIWATRRSPRGADLDPRPRPSRPSPATAVTSPDADRPATSSSYQMREGAGSRMISGARSYLAEAPSATACPSAKLPRELNGATAARRGGRSVRPPHSWPPAAAAGEGFRGGPRRRRFAGDGRRTRRGAAVPGDYDIRTSVDAPTVSRGPRQGRTCPPVRPQIRVHGRSWRTDARCEARFSARRTCALTLTAAAHYMVEDSPA